MSLQYWPHEDLHVKPAAHSAMHSGELKQGGNDYVPIAIVNLTLALSLVSFAANGGVIGTLVVLGLIAGFNVLALKGRT